MKPSRPIPGPFAVKISQVRRFHFVWAKHPLRYNSWYSDTFSCAGIELSYLSNQCLLLRNCWLLNSREWKIRQLTFHPFQEITFKTSVNVPLSVLELRLDLVCLLEGAYFSSTFEVWPSLQASQSFTNGWLMKLIKANLTQFLALDLSRHCHLSGPRLVWAVLSGWLIPV